MTEKCRLVMREYGKDLKKMVCEQHEQHLIYVYSIRDHTLGFRCQVGEDLCCKVETEYFDEVEPEHFRRGKTALRKVGEEKK